MVDGAKFNSHDIITVAAIFESRLLKIAAALSKMAAARKKFTYLRN